MKCRYTQTNTCIAHWCHTHIHSVCNCRKYCAHSLYITWNTQPNTHKLYNCEFTQTITSTHTLMSFEHAIANSTNTHTHTHSGLRHSESNKRMSELPAHWYCVCVCVRVCVNTSTDTNKHRCVIPQHIRMLSIDHTHNIHMWGLSKLRCWDDYVCVCDFSLA
jgi:hypothetical protein